MQHILNVSMVTGYNSEDTIINSKPSKFNLLPLEPVASLNDTWRKYSTIIDNITIITHCNYQAIVTKILRH